MDVKSAAMLSRFLKKGELRKLIIALAFACLAVTLLLAPLWGAWR